MKSVKERPFLSKHGHVKRSSHNRRCRQKPAFFWGILAVLLVIGLFPALPARSDDIARAAEHQVGITTRYEPAYRILEYPGGDVPVSEGVCTDVVIRALRAVGLDLQRAVHEDMKKNFSAYPKFWGLKSTDRNIDHRRVPNLMTYFRRAGWEVKNGRKSSDFRAGDVVAWRLPNGLYHIGIVSSRKTAEEHPFVIHNIGRGTVFEDVLFAYEILGQYRMPASRNNNR